MVRCLFEGAGPDVIIADNGLLVVQLPSQPPGHERTAHEAAPGAVASGFSVELSAPRHQILTAVASALA